MIFNMIFRTPW